MSSKFSWNNLIMNEKMWWLTFLPFINHVILAGGNEVPTVQTALKLSVGATTFLSICIIGSSLGSSITCILATRRSVWKSGKSSDTSHWNCPLRSRVTPRNVTDVVSDWDSWIFMIIVEESKNVILINEIHYLYDII